MRRQTVSFSNGRGDTLLGDLYEPVGATRALVLFAHCFTCAANWKAPVRIARALAAEGFAVLVFDFTGLGRSEGEFADTNFTTNVADLVAAARYLESVRGEGPALLVGHSLGGTAALAAAADIASAKAIVTIAAPSSAAHVTHLLEGGQEQLEATGEAVVHIGGRPFRIKQQLLRDLEEGQVPGNLRALRRALLVMHSPYDEIVPIAEATEIFTSALHPKSFVSLGDADHLLNDEADADYAAAVLAAWASRYVAAPRPAVAAEGERDGGVVARTGAEGFFTEIDAGGHTLVADEPVAVGGGDQGPSPYALLAAALASCTSMTLQMYARHKGWPLEEARVRVRHSRVHAKDCKDCPQDSNAKIDLLEREVAVTGPLDAAAQERLIEIANRCPVHRTLEGKIVIETTLAPTR